VLEQASKDVRREVVKAATRLYKSGAEPSEGPAPVHLNRAEIRQTARAMGWRGKKAKRQNVVRRSVEIRRAVLVDEALGLAKERVDHPVRSRLKKGA
jgi:hypothetical protein